MIMISSSDKNGYVVMGPGVDAENPESQPSPVSPRSTYHQHTLSDTPERQHEPCTSELYYITFAPVKLTVKSDIN